MDINKFLPKETLQAKSLITMDNLSEYDIYEILYLAKKIKMSGRVKERFLPFSERTIAFIIGSEYSNMRIPFELSVTQLGGHTLYLSPKDIDFKNGLSYIDAIKTLKAYGVSGMVIKESDEKVLQELISNSPVPLINVYDTINSPCNVLATLLTLWEEKNVLNNLNICFLGHSKGLKPSTIKGYSKCGINVSIVSPITFTPKPQDIQNASQYNDINISDDIDKGTMEADLISSVFPPKSSIKKEDMEILKDYFITETVMQNAKQDTKFITNSSINNDEVSHSLLYSEYSLVLKKAENLIYILKALMILLIK